MLTTAHRAFITTKGVVLARVLIGFLFFFSGVGILMQGIGGTAMYFESLGIPLAAVAAWLVVALKLIAGGALMAGYHVEKAALALIVFTLIATAIAHLDLQDPGLFKNLAIIGGLIYAMAHAIHKPHSAM